MASSSNKLGAQGRRWTFSVLAIPSEVERMGQSGDDGRSARTLAPTRLDTKNVVRWTVDSTCQGRANVERASLATSGIASLVRGHPGGCTNFPIRRTGRGFRYLRSDMPFGDTTTGFLVAGQGPADPPGSATALQR